MHSGRRVPQRLRPATGQGWSTGAATSACCRNYREANILPWFDFADLFPPVKGEHRLLFLPDGGRRLVLETTTTSSSAGSGWAARRVSAGDGAGMAVDATPAATAGRVPGEGGRRGPGARNPGPGGGAGRDVVAQVSAQDDSEEADLSGVVSPTTAGRPGGRPASGPRPPPPGGPGKSPGGGRVALERLLRSDERVGLPQARRRRR